MDVFFFFTNLCENISQAEGILSSWAALVLQQNVADDVREDVLKDALTDPAWSHKDL